MTKTTEQDTTSGNANETDKPKLNSKELVQQFPIEKTPFTVIKMNDEYFLTLGKYRLTEPMNSLEECEEDAKDASWFRIMQIIQIMIDEHEAKKQLTTKPQ